MARKHSQYVTVSANVDVDVDVDLGDVEDEPLVEELKGRGYSVEKNVAPQVFEVSDIIAKIEADYKAKVLQTTISDRYMLNVAGRDISGRGCATIIVLDGV
jgi:hypothetical protein